MDEIEIVKDWAGIAAPFTSAIIDTWLKPKLMALLRDKDADRKVVEHNILGKFGEYLTRAFERQSYLTTLVFGNQKTRLEDLYIPLRVKSEALNRSIMIDCYPSSFIPKYRHVLLTDSAGVGKSTILKFLFVEAIKCNVGIPIFIELRQLTSSTSILDFIRLEVASLGKDVESEFILKLLDRGDFILFLDGYDEIPQSERQCVTRDLAVLFSKARNTNIIMASRPDMSTISFNSFQQFTVEPLTDNEAYALIRKYDFRYGLADEIIQKLKRRSFKNVHEFLTNPLLVSLLYKSYEFKRTIPLRKPIFYRQVYDALFETHDLTKGGAYIREKRSGLDSDDFHRLLRALGFITMKIGAVEYSRDELLRHVDEAITRCPGICAKEADFILDLEISVPLFAKDGNYYRWTHKSVQEYFAAQFICIDSKEYQQDILCGIYESANIIRYINLLDLCYDIDYKSFRDAIIYQIVVCALWPNNALKEFASRGILKAAVQRRVQVTFGNKFLFVSRNYMRKLAEEKAGSDRWLPQLIRLANVDNSVSRRYDRVLQISTTGAWSHNPEVIKFASGACLLVFASSASLILRFMRDKGDDLVLPSTKKPHDDDNENRVRAVLPSDVYGNVVPVLLSMSPDITLNLKENFERVTEAICVSDPPMLNVSKCEALLKVIDAERLVKTPGDFFTRGL